MSMSTVMATPTFIEDRRDFIGFDGGPAGYVGPPLRWDAVMKKLAWLLLGGDGSCVRGLGAEQCHESPGGLHDGDRCILVQAGEFHTSDAADTVMSIVGVHLTYFAIHELSEQLREAPVFTPKARDRRRVEVVEQVRRICGVS